MAREVPVLVLLALFGCPESTIADYEAARAEALADPPALTEDWKPDAVLHMSPELLDRMAAVAIKGRGEYTDSFELLGGTATVAPKLDVTDVQLATPDDACEGCLAVDTTLEGVVAYKVAGKRGELPLTVVAGVDVSVRTGQTNRTWTMTATPKKVRDVRIDLEGLPKALEKVAEERIEKAVRDNLLDGIGDWSMTAIDGSALPVRAARLAPSRRGMRVDLLTEASTPQTVSPQAKLREGWRLDVATDTLNDLARREAFKAGPVSHDVVVDPVALRIGHGTFELDLRLWMTTGNGWWRDYTVVGDLTKGKKRFSMKAVGVDQKGASPGAALADPLAYLGEGVILSAIEEGAQGAFPSESATFAHGHTWNSKVTSIYGTGETVTITGDVELKPPKKLKALPGKGR